MTEQNKKINRRDFIKQMTGGLTGVAAGFIGLNGDAKTRRLLANTTKMIGKNKRPWWVKEVDEPTIEIDWDRLQRFNFSKTAQGGGFEKYVGETEYRRLQLIEENNEYQRIQENIPGYSLRDHAFGSAHSGLSNKRSFLGAQSAPTPEERGTEKWVGTPKEATRMLRSVMRHFGAGTVGIVEINEKTKKLIYSHDPDGRAIIFEDVEKAYEDSEKRVIPNTAKWIIVYTVQMSLEALKRSPTVIAQQTTNLSYNRGSYIQSATQNFLHGLGYQGLGEATLNGLGISPALGVMAGLGEMSRLNRMITPEYGPMVRVFKMITDLPLQPDKPIDAGIMDFCKTCKKCAEACPPAALSIEDEPTWEVEGPWSNFGHKAFFEDSIKCRTYWKEKPGTNCGICFAVCPYSKDNKVWMHSWAQGFVSKFPFLNKYFRNLDDAFSYGAMKSVDEWWDLDLPEYGINTERVVED